MSQYKEILALAEMVGQMWNRQERPRVTLRVKTAEYHELLAARYADSLDWNPEVDKVPQDSLNTKCFEFWAPGANVRIENTDLKQNWE